MVTALKEQGKDKNKAKEKETKGKEPAKKRLRRKYVASPESEEETEDNSQFKVVIHAPQSKVDSICENIVKHADFSGLKNLNFDELRNDEKIRIEEAMYDMMA